MGDNSGGQVAINPDLSMEVQEVSKKIENVKVNIIKKEMEMEYRNEDLGPFHIFVESNNLEKAGVGRLHPMTLGKLINISHPDLANNILLVNKVGINRVRVELNSAQSANTLMKSAVLKEKGFKAYIPSYRLQRKGVIREVSTDLSDEEIKSQIKGPNGRQLEILEIRRIKRKVNDAVTKETKMVDTESIFINIRGQILPPFVFLLFVRCKVHQYTQSVIQCRKCLRYGHFQDQCRGKTRCEKCGGDHPVVGCTSETYKCVNCSSDKHMSTNRQQCPSYNREKSVKQAMANYNIPYNDAKLFVKNNRVAGHAELPTPNIEDINQFPVLSKINPIVRAPVNFPEKRGIKRNKIGSPPLASPKGSKIDRDALYLEHVPKNVQGGLIKSNPYSASRDDVAAKPQPSAKTPTSDVNYELIYETVFSVIKNMQNFGSNMNDEKLKVMIRDRIKSFQ